ncbi:hypothetical protein DET1060 [Dehalococcoides mccartyi 195]|uniref:Uncharacterized protein n=1 Tax=Dehalococcoides mccartyi (strain ATCC BAA-2266 / KCTC 15142 / 195) TaxID=243164 RepID=Q3Z7M4_DEHM1|nr:hypothetical protein DET1060 [Dehalococcoides mccartyi 195]
MKKPPDNLKTTPFPRQLCKLQILLNTTWCAAVCRTNIYILNFIYPIYPPIFSN